MLIRGALIVGTAYWMDDWLAGAAIAVILLVWWLLGDAEGPPVLALALTYQWAQVTIGMFYSALTGEQLAAIISSDWRPMVMIGLGCVSCLAISLYAMLQFLNRRLPSDQSRPTLAASAVVLYIAYVASIFMTGIIQEIAWDYPSFTQAILAMNFTHLALVFLLARRFTRPVFAWQKLAALMALEVGLGFTGY